MTSALDPLVLLLGAAFAGMRRAVTYRGGLETSLRFTAVTLLALLHAGAYAQSTAMRVGRFTVQLPGTWVLLSDRHINSGSQSGTSSTPTQHVVAYGVKDGRDKPVVVILRAPSSTFVGVSRWQDDPCKNYRTALVKDTLGQTFAMPECLAIEEYATQNILRSEAAVMQDIAQWLKRTDAPQSLLHVHYSKYHGGDFLHFNSYHALPKDAAPQIEGWARQVASHLHATVVGGSAGTLMAFPSSIDTAPPTGPRPKEPRSVETRLTELKSLFDRGLITEQDFDQRRKQILDSI